MKASLPYAVIGFGVIIMALIAWWFGFREEKQDVVPQVPPPEITEGISIYTNGEHGILLTYPNGAIVSEMFDAPNLPQTWRMHALPDAAGAPIVSITTYQTQNEQSYPRHYRTLVRIGSSSDPREVAACEQPRAEQGETILSDKVIGDRTFKVFSFGDAAMMQYVSGTSYRAVRNDTCIAIEAIRAGSTYREEATEQDIPEATLEAEFRALDAIVESVRFVR
ncbi:MAG TPA: hypothetical protein VNU47_01050 [Candidatus Paceibacterota bacterium]|nr:hypothetical protein [Candidatus Paceibacterota bacterium]